MNSFVAFFHSPVVMPTLTAWVLAQCLKVITHFHKYRKIDWGKLLSTGGMPSSHSAFVCSVAMSIGYTAGFDSPSFMASAALASIVMSDAAGVRRAAGKQAKAINEIVRLMENKMAVPPDKLKELLGHSPLEVLFGAMLGIFISFCFALFR